MLDTDAVNAFAAPGGYVHITKGCLALIANESELAGVLGHELTHVVEDHTIKALSKAGFVDTAASASGKGGEITRRPRQPGDQHRAAGLRPRRGAGIRPRRPQPRRKAGYQPDGLRTFLQRLTDRNKNSTEKRGLFASHPAMQERLDKLAAQEKKERASTVTLEARYQQFISYKPVPQSQIATVAAGSSGLASGGSSSAKKSDDTPARTARRRTRRRPRRSPRRRASAWAASAQPGRRREEVGPDRGLGRRARARSRSRRQGRPQPGLVSVDVSAADIDAFRKEASWRDALVPPAGAPVAVVALALSFATPQPGRARQAALRRRRRGRGAGAARGALGCRSWRVDPAARRRRPTPPLIAARRSSSRLVAALLNPLRADRPSARFPNIVQDAVIVVLVRWSRPSSFATPASSPRRRRAPSCLGLALQDTLGNAIAGLAIQIEQPFRVGHWIRVGDHVGVVEEITWRATKLRTRPAPS